MWMLWLHVGVQSSYAQGSRRRPIASLAKKHPSSHGSIIVAQHAAVSFFPVLISKLAFFVFVVVDHFTSLAEPSSPVQVESSVKSRSENDLQHH